VEGKKNKSVGRGAKEGKKNLLRERSRRKGGAFPEKSNDLSSERSEIAGGYIAHPLKISRENPVKSKTGKNAESRAFEKVPPRGRTWPLIQGGETTSAATNGETQEHILSTEKKPRKEKGKKDRSKRAHRGE